MGCCGSYDEDKGITSTSTMKELIKAIDEKIELYKVEIGEIRDYLDGKRANVTLIDVDGVAPGLLEKRIISLKNLIQANEFYMKSLESHPNLRLQDAKEFVLRLQRFYQQTYNDPKQVDEEIKLFQDFINQNHS